MPKILVIEDDVELNRKIRDWLNHERHTVEYAEEGQCGLDKLLSSDFDLVILDWEMPLVSGLEVVRQYRETGGKAPVIMLTGRSEIQDKEHGFEAGVDDYLTKPFHLKELSLRVNSLLKRSGTLVKDLLKIQDITLETKTFRVTKGNRAVVLLPTEFALLEFLLRHPDQVFSAETLLRRVWSTDSEASMDAVTTCIKRLRRKLDDGKAPSIIRTIHGVGYKVESNPEL